MIKRDRRFAVKDVGLTQAEAAELLATDPGTVGRQERGDAARGPATGAIEYLIATWPLLSERARKQVRERLAQLRAAG